jgi:magnesium chelatase subunit D
MTVWLKNPELLINYTNTIKKHFSLGKAVRIGESAIVSTKVHGTVPGKPGTVFVLCQADAGKTFYGIPEEGKVVHLDLFHDIAELEPKIIADHIKISLENYNGWLNTQDLFWQFEYMDLQTAKGGGKLNGLLNYGKTTELKKSHLNHVHLAIKLEPNFYFLLFHIVDGIEKGIISQGCGLKKIEFIKHRTSQINKASLPAGQVVSTDSCLSKGIENYRQYADYGIQKNYGKLINLVEELGDYQEVEQIINYFLRPVGSYLAESWADKQFFNGEKVIKTMIKLNLIQKYRGIYELTGEGKSFLGWFCRFKSELELDFNKLTLQSTKSGLKLCRKNYSLKTSKKNKGRRNRKSVTSADALGWIEDLSSVETVKNMVKNYKLNGSRTLKRRDIMVYNGEKTYPIDVCIILDASISMSGKPIRAAKSFIRYLSVNNKNRIGIVVFQENRVTAKLVFTKNVLTIKRFLTQIRPKGLTPLAAGLEEGLKLCQSSRLNNPVLLLITDGQPTIGKWTDLPDKDAIKVVQKIAKSKIKFCCIGLQADKEFLQKLAEEARGILYLVDEIDQKVLTAIFKRER